MVVWFYAEANFCYCPSCLEKILLASKVVKSDQEIIISLHSIQSLTLFVLKLALHSSYNGYNDELVWAALWLYKATGNSSYLTYAKNGYATNGFSENNELLSWDSKVAGIKILMAKITGEASHVQDVTNLCDYFINQAPRSSFRQISLKWTYQKA